MAELPRRFMPHHVTVRPLTGTGAYGDQFGPPVAVQCMVDDTRRMVRATDGAEVISESTLYARLAATATLVERSKVTLPSGREATVISSSTRDDGNLGAWQHLEVNLT